MCINTCTVSATVRNDTCEVEKNDVSGGEVSVGTAYRLLVEGLSEVAAFEQRLKKGCGTASSRWTHTSRVREVQAEK